MSWAKIDQRKNNFAGRYIYHGKMGKIIAEAVQAEREACAMECMNLFAKYNIERSQINSNYITGKISGALECAEAIRVKRVK